jgi:V/A-type H+/Na+-transporting ATPase subunit I
MGFLRPVPMVKVGLVGLKSDREAVVALLHDLGVIQIEPLRKEALELLEPEHGGELQRQVSDGLLRFRTLKGALPPVPDGPPAEYASLDAVLQAAAAVTVDAELLELKREEDALITEGRDVATTIELLERHRYYTEPLRLLRSARLLSFFGESTPPALDRLRGEISAIGESAFVPGPRSKEVARFLLAVPQEEADAVARIAQPAGVHLAAIPALDGTIEAELPPLHGRHDAIEGRLTQIRARLAAIAQEWYGRIASLEEAFAIENRKFEAWTRMGAGRYSFALEGWVPARTYARLETTLRERVGDRIDLRRVPTDEEPPTLMDNPPGVRWYEFFIKFYSLPQATEFDPTWIFALAFPLFFGIMLGDAGYGLVILGICLWMIAGFPGGHRVPKGLRGFVTMIMGPKGMQLLARTLLPGCLLAIALGVAFNEYFGAHLPFYTGVFDPLHQASKLLLLAGYIGLAMVTIGFGLGALKAYYHHHRREMVAKIGGIAFAWGVAGLGLLVIYGIFSVSTILSDLALGALVAGLALILVGEGAQGAMALTEIVSHILSYLRLVGILLASVILALVINTVTWGMFVGSTPSIGLRIAYLAIGALILIVGQMFNLVLGVFEPGIQGARLIFVEHFSKFYEGNGRPFQPFGSRRTHTRPASGDAKGPFLEGSNST